jgi:hypothetical protein
VSVVFIKIEDAPPELAALIRQMHERQENILIKNGENSVAYLNLAYRPDLWEKPPGAAANASPEPGRPAPQGGVGKLTSEPVVDDDSSSDQTPPTHHGVTA